MGNAHAVHPPCSLGSPMSRPVSSRRRRQRQTLFSMTFVLAVTVLYIALCHVPYFGTGLPRFAMFPGAMAQVPVALARGPSALTTAQCTMVRDDFVKMFMDHDSGEILDCHSLVVALVWDHVIVRQYGVERFDDLRSYENGTNTGLSDIKISQLLMRAAVGAYVDTTDPTRSFTRIRADPYNGRVVRVPGSSDMQVTMLEVALVAALVAVWQSWWLNR